MSRILISDAMATDAAAYREAIASNIRDNDGYLTKHFKKIVAEMPPPPDPFWKGWEL